MQLDLRLGIRLGHRSDDANFVKQINNNELNLLKLNFFPNYFMVNYSCQRNKECKRKQRNLYNK